MGWVPPPTYAKHSVSTTKAVWGETRGTTPFVYSFSVFCFVHTVMCYKPPTEQRKLTNIMVREGFAHMPFVVQGCAPYDARSNETVVCIRVFFVRSGTYICLLDASEGGGTKPLRIKNNLNKNMVNKYLHIYFLRFRAVTYMVQHVMLHVCPHASFRTEGCVWTNSCSIQDSLSPG